MSLLVPSAVALETTPRKLNFLSIAFDSTEKTPAGVDPFATVMGAQRGTSSMPGATDRLADDMNSDAFASPTMVMVSDGQTISHSNAAPVKIDFAGTRRVLVPTWRYAIAPKFHTRKDFVKAVFSMKLPQVRDNAPARYTMATFQALTPVTVQGQKLPHSAEFVFNRANLDGNWKFVLECDIDAGDGSLIFTGVLASFFGDRNV